MGEPKEYSHCIDCRRKLKNPKWRKIGRGPKCFKKWDKKPKARVIQMEMDI
jgi:hypothetical protein